MLTQGGGFEQQRGPVFAQAPGSAPLIAQFFATPGGHVPWQMQHADPRFVERVLAENHEIKNALARQQAWIDSQPVRKHISEGLELMAKDPVSWKRIARRVALAAGAVTFTALAAPAITSGIPFWTLAWLLPASMKPVVGGQ